MKKQVTLITDEPTIEVIAEQKIVEAGVLNMAEWVKTHRPDCVPAEGFSSMWDLLPHDRHDSPVGGFHTDQRFKGLTDNEVLCEIAGRKCYDSFAEKAGKKTNAEYFGHIFSMDPIHNSILYHAKMTFFFAGVSRKFSHQFIRNYVGSDRDEEGSPSQESTRFTHHYGWYVLPPYDLHNIGASTFAPAPNGLLMDEVEAFRRDCQDNYDRYCDYIERKEEAYKFVKGHYPSGGDRKEIYEAAAGRLSMSAETSFVWTTNPMALRKFLKERCHGAADAEIFRFALKLARICFERWPNLFQGKDLDGVRWELAAGKVAHGTQELAVEGGAK